MLARKTLVATALAGCLAAPSVVFATNGYFSPGTGIKNLGTAGAGVAFPQDALAAAVNPAGMVFVGDRMDLGASLFSPNRKYEASPTFPAGTPAFQVQPGNNVSDNTLFLIPNFGYNKMIDANSSIGFTLYGNGGMNTEYDNKADGALVFGNKLPGVYGAGRTGVDLIQLFGNLSYSRKFADKASWGVGVILAAQSFEATGLSNFGFFVADGNPDDLTDNGHDYSYGYGFQAGVQGEVLPGLTLAASYRSKMYMSEFDDYSDLFAEEGDFDIPATAWVGLAWRPVPQHTLLFDVQQIWYEDIDALANKQANLTNCPAFRGIVGAPGGDQSNCLGGDNGAGFGWDDMTVFKVGYIYEPNPEWAFRLGFSTTNQPVSSADVAFNILAPAVVEKHYSVGLTKKMGKTNEINFVGMYSPSNSIKGTHPFDGGNQTIELSMHQYLVGVSWSWLWD